MSKLIANRAFRYASREISADEEFEADSKDMLVLTSTNNPLARVVSGGGEVETRALKNCEGSGDLLNQTEAASDKKSKRYNRRDMRAES